MCNTHTHTCMYICKHTYTYTHTHAHTYTQVNNASCLVNQYTLNDDGFETNFATNSLGKIMSKWYNYN